ncbi:unannotated protein [freshwater metagenome]|uniref:Unannotated protein n=1 Tax=freshwater metagenome TaxID=449393 RepID=A0A6J7CJB2_9ZZZZ|nr:hypothetical protein [Actinomycetota bacterium]MUH57633.1 hypothetical protein [Actinomycetota bacterium]
MSRRIEIEITSINGEVATWRAAGAKLPKGSLATSLLPSGTTAGAEFRADVEQNMEGVEILAVLPVKSASPLDLRGERITIVAKAPTGPDIQVTYASKGGKGRRDGDGPRGRRDGDDARPRRDDKGSRGPRAGGPAGEGADKGGRPARPRTNDRRGPRPERPVGPPLLTVHRNAFLATLNPEQLPVAEQLLRGGLPAVRTAVAEQNKTATAQGRTTVNADAIDRIATDLLGKANLAMWKDRAAGAQSAGRDLRLRDLRPVVTSAKTVSLDEEARAMLKDLQAQLTAQIDVLSTEWLAKIATAIETKNALEALTLAARPPEFRMQVASESAAAIAALASESLNETLAPAQWIVLVQAAVASPMHRTIKPSGIPADDACRNEAIKVAGAVPELAKLLGMKVPPPPPRTITPRRPRPATRS